MGADPPALVELSDALRGIATRVADEMLNCVLPMLADTEAPDLRPHTLASFINLPQLTRVLHLGGAPPIMTQFSRGVSQVQGLLFGCTFRT